MNLSELKQKIDSIYSRCRCPDEIIVGVSVRRLNSVGGTSIASISNIHKGGDWDNNKLIITPELELRESDRNEVESMKKELSEMGWSLYEFQNLKRENAKLKKQIHELMNNI